MAINEMYRPFLVGEKVYLRSLEKEDLDNMLQWANDPEVTKYMCMGTFPNTMEALEYEYDYLINTHRTSSLIQFDDSPNTIILAIIHRRDERHIGDVGIFDINWLHRLAELRIVIGEKAYWRKGIATEAYKLVTKYAFDRLNLRRLTGGTRIDNIGEIKTFEKVGFIREGVRRQHVVRNNKAYDVVDFGLLGEEFNG